MHAFVFVAVLRDHRRAKLRTIAAGSISTSGSAFSPFSPRHISIGDYSMYRHE